MDKLRYGLGESESSAVLQTKISDVIRYGDVFKRPFWLLVLVSAAAKVKLAQTWRGGVTMAQKTYLEPGSLLKDLLNGLRWYLIYISGQM